MEINYCDKKLTAIKGYTYKICSFILNNWAKLVFEKSNKVFRFSWNISFFSAKWEKVWIKHIFGLYRWGNKNYPILRPIFKSNIYQNIYILQPLLQPWGRFSIWYSELRKHYFFLSVPWSQFKKKICFRSSLEKLRQTVERNTLWLQLPSLH